VSDRGSTSPDPRVGVRVAGVGVALTTLVVLLAVLAGVVPRVAGLYPGAVPENPYFVPGRAGLLYLLMPVVVMATLTLLMAPGTLAVLAFGHRGRLSTLILKAFVVSFAAFVVGFGALHLVFPVPSTAAFSATMLLVLVLAFAAWATRAVRGDVAAGFPFERGRLVALASLTFAVLVTSIPVLFWQDINPDGLEGLSTGRSLAYHILPRLPNGLMPGLDLGMVTMAYPIHWMIVLFGHLEVAARLPFLLYLALIYAGVTALIERDAARRLSGSEEATVALTLGVFAVTLIFSDTYHPYSADVASPANIDLLAVGGMLGTAYFFFDRNRSWTIAFAFLTHLTRPTGVMFLGLLGAATLLVSRRDWRWRVATLGAALGACVAWTVLYEHVLASLIGVPIEAGTSSIARRLRFLRFDDFGRLLWVVVPGGIVPAVSVFWYRRLDESSRSLLLVSGGYFLFFYVLAFTALHHFAPVMLLPVVLFWRVLLQRERSGAWAGAAAVGALAALIVSLPAGSSVDRRMRELGRATDFGIGDYSGDFDAYREAYRHKDILDSLFRPIWLVDDPGAEQVGSPWVQIHYASAASSPPDSIRYLVLPGAAAPPPGFERVAADSAAALYVRDRERWVQDRRSPPRTDFRSPIYAVPKETLFPFWGIPAGTYDLDLRDVLPDFVLSRLGPER